MTYPRILGHELGVEVLSVGPGVTGIKPGDRCAVEPYLNCGTCRPCQLNRGNCCEDLRVLGVHTDGGMRESVVVPAAKLHPSAVLGLDALALVEPLAIGAHAVARSGLDSGEHALVIGAGPIGRAVIEFCRITGARITVLDLVPSRLSACAGLVDRAVSSLPEAETFDAVFDATGHPGSMAAAVHRVGFAGRLTYVGITRESITFPDPLFHRREMTFFASRNALPDDFRRIIGWLEEGEIDVNRWITHRASLFDLPGMIGSWADPKTGVLKAVLEVA
jgi:2-desacetyl-2-hydroxyethyl bacteriochlorophyllide A dehydrogenase